MQRLTSILLLLLSLLPFSVGAFSCHNSIVETGMYKQEVLNRCGDPENIDTHIEKRAVNNSAGVSQYYGGTMAYPNGALNMGQQQYYEIDIVVEEWFYNFGRRRFQQLLRFENGKLVDIKELGYGR
ncbi:MAG: DUF2845 domain-containing protein [Methylococcales bacterium]